MASKAKISLNNILLNLNDLSHNLTGYILIMADDNVGINIKSYFFHKSVDRILIL